MSLRGTLSSVVARHNSAEAISEIATHLSGARNDKKEIAHNDKRRRAGNDREEWRKIELPPFRKIAASL
jgi:hypothetical protein